MESLKDGRVCMHIFEQKYTLYKMTSHFRVLKLIYYKMGGFPPSNHYKMDLENPVYMGPDSSPFYRGNFYEDIYIHICIYVLYIYIYTHDQITTNMKDIIKEQHSTDSFAALLLVT